MSSRKKLTISLTVVALVIVAAVVAVVGVLAATQQTVESAISIRFVASDVSGSLSMRSQVQTMATDMSWAADKTSTGTATYTFEASDEDGTGEVTEGSFDIGSATPIDITGMEEALHLEYTFTRSGDVNYGVSITFTGNDDGKFIAQYNAGSGWVDFVNGSATTVLTSVAKDDGDASNGAESAVVMTRVKVNPVYASKEITNTGLGFTLLLDKTLAA